MALQTDPKPPQPETTTRAGLILNLFPATFSASEVPVVVAPYVSAEAQTALQGTLAGHTLWRDATDADRMYGYAHPGIELAARADLRRAVVRLPENPQLFANILRGGVARHLTASGFSAIGRRGGGFVNWTRGNLLDDLKVSGYAHADPRVGIFPRITIDTFLTGASDGDPIIGLVVDVGYVTRLDLPVDELIAAGFDVRGKYVKLRTGSGLAPLLEGLTIGRVRAIESGELVLDDVRDPALARVVANACVLDPVQWNLEAYLRHKAGPRGNVLLARISERFASVTTPATKLQLTQTFVNVRIAASPTLPLAAGLDARIGSAITAAPDDPLFRTSELTNATFSFDPESPKTHVAADEGLRTFGPYGRARMRGRTVRVLVLAPELFKGTTQTFLQAFRSGIADRRLFAGFQTKFRLDGLELVERYFAGGTTKEAYYNAATSAIEERADYDLAIVVVREDFKQLAAAENPYFVVKAFLLSLGIVVQNARIETIRQGDGQLKWALNQMALACYAKMGGAPFVLRTRPTPVHELVFGIGRSIDRPAGSRLGPSAQVIGFTTVFKSDGDYLLNACTPYTDAVNYGRHLEQVIDRAVREAITSEGIADGATVRLIFHVYKRTGRQEVAAIENAIAKMTKVNVEYALLQVNDSHNFRLYDRRTAEQLPSRRTAVAIGPRERLVVLIGPSEYRRRGNPAPVRVTLDRNSTFRDLDYLVEQLYQLTCVSWRSFNVTTQPVTIFYSELMARLNRELRTIAAHWNQDIVRLKLARRLWFL